MRRVVSCMSKKEDDAKPVFIQTTKEMENWMHPQG